MRPFVGHKETLATLPKELPPVTLLIGPEGVGKRYLARLLALRTEATGLDLQELGPLTVASATALREHHASAPVVSPVRVTVADLTNSRPQALNAILKILEEPPERSRFILHTDREPPLTIKSRAFQLRFGLLSVEEVAEVMKHIGANDPGGAAKLSGGRVSTALTYAKHTEARQRVEALLTALRGRDERKLEQALFMALKTDSDDLEGAREAVVMLLTKSLHASLSQEDHILAPFPEEVRLSALRILRSKARPPMKIRGAVWTLVGAR